MRSYLIRIFQVDTRRNRNEMWQHSGKTRTVNSKEMGQTASSVLVMTWHAYVRSFTRVLISTKTTVDMSFGFGIGDI